MIISQWKNGDRTFFSLEVDDRLLLIDIQCQVYLGLAWSLGCLVFGLLVVRRGAECSVSRHYLTQAASILAGTAIMAFTQVNIITT